MTIGIVGAGQVGGALGLYFIRHGLDLAGYFSRRDASAQAAARRTGSNAYCALEELAEASSVLIFTTPDRALEEMDALAAAWCQKAKHTDRVFLHTSGARPSDAFAKLKALGCDVGSLHPLQSFGEPEGSAKRLEQSYFSIEGTKGALCAMKTLLGKTGGSYNQITPGQKPLYHAGACMISNYLVTVLDSGIRYLIAAGLDPETVGRAIGPLISGTLSNLREKKPPEALTGPIARGDVSTVAVQLDAIGRELPEELAFFQALARKTVSMARERLTGEQSEQFMKLLKGDELQ